ncbi:MAG: hypothetical protein WC442_06180 [Candidatus Omnitrophota bacterium]
MNKAKVLKGLLFTFLGILFFTESLYADIVFPAIAHQFMVSLVVPSYYSIVLAVLIILVETFFIQRLFTLNFIISVILSFIINLISSVAGVFTVIFLEVWTRDICMGIFGYSNMRLGTYLGMIPGYVLTVLLEGILLFLITPIIRKKLQIMDCIKTSALMNVCSYLIILIGVALADIITKGANFKTY